MYPPLFLLFSRNFRFGFLTPASYASLALDTTKLPPVSPPNENVRFVQSRNVRFHGWRVALVNGANHVEQRERDRLKVLHEVNRSIFRSRAAARLKVSGRQRARMLLAFRDEGDSS